MHLLIKNWARIPIHDIIVIVKYDNFMDKENAKAVNRARVTASWSYLGLVVPLVGWILGANSLSNLSSIDVKYADNNKRTIKSVKKMAIGGILLSTAVFLTYIGVFYNHRQSVQKDDKSIIQKTVENERQCLVSAAQAFSPQMIDAENQFVGNGGGISREAVHSLRMNYYLELNPPITTYSQAAQECRQTAKDKYGTISTTKKLTATYQSCVHDYYWSNLNHAQKNDLAYQYQVEYCRNRLYFNE